MQVICVWEIRAAEDQYTIQVNFSDVSLGVNGKNELSIIDGSGTFGGDLKRKMTGVDVNPVDYSSVSNVVGIVLVAEPVPDQRGFNLTWQGRVGFFQYLFHGHWSPQSPWHCINANSFQHKAWNKVDNECPQRIKNDEYVVVESNALAYIGSLFISATAITLAVIGSL